MIETERIKWIKLFMVCKYKQKGENSLSGDLLKQMKTIDTDPQKIKKQICHIKDSMHLISKVLPSKPTFLGFSRLSFTQGCL